MGQWCDRKIADLLSWLKDITLTTTGHWQWTCHLFASFLLGQKPAAQNLIGCYPNGQNVWTEHKSGLLQSLLLGQDRLHVPCLGSFTFIAKTPDKRDCVCLGRHSVLVVKIGYERETSRERERESERRGREGRRVGR